MFRMLRAFSVRPPRSALDKIVKLELLEQHSPKEITNIWLEHHKGLNGLSAVVPAEFWDKFDVRSKQLCAFPLSFSFFALTLCAGLSLCFHCRAAADLKFSSFSDKTCTFSSPISSPIVTIRLLPFRCLISASTLSSKACTPQLLHLIIHVFFVRWV
jgi:hypothetical protein